MQKWRPTVATEYAGLKTSSISIFVPPDFVLESNSVLQDLSTLIFQKRLVPSCVMMIRGGDRFLILRIPDWNSMKITFLNSNFCFKLSIYKKTRRKLFRFLKKKMFASKFLKIQSERTFCCHRIWWQIASKSEKNWLNIWTLLHELEKQKKASLV